MWHRLAFVACAAALAAALSGCSKDEEPIRNPAGGKPPTAKAPDMNPEAMAKAHSEKAGASSADLAKLKKDQEAAKAAFDKAPNDAKAKSAYVDATVKLGTATMYSPDLTPREKYGGALKYYREALAADPKNVEAGGNKKMIEDIYKQMGRPVPQ